MNALHKSWLGAEAATSIDLPAHWASALMNDDKSALRNDYHDLAEFELWAVQNPTLRHPASCSDEQFIGRWRGLICMLLTYTYLNKGETK